MTCHNRNNNIIISTEFILLKLCSHHLILLYFFRLQLQDYNQNLNHKAFWPIQTRELEIFEHQNSFWVISEFSRRIILAMALDCTTAMTAACAQAFEDFLTAPKRSLGAAWSSRTHTSSSSGGNANLDAIENIILSANNGEHEVMNRIHHIFTAIGQIGGIYIVLLLIAAYVVALDHHLGRLAHGRVNSLPTWTVYMAIEGFHLSLACIYGLKFGATVALIVNVAASVILAHEGVLNDNCFRQGLLLLLHLFAPLVSGLTLCSCWGAFTYSEDNPGATWKDFMEVVFWRTMGEDGFSWLALVELAIGILALYICLMDSSTWLGSWVGPWVHGCMDRIWAMLKMGLVSCIAFSRVVIKMFQADTEEEVDRLFE